MKKITKRPDYLKIAKRDIKAIQKLQGNLNKMIDELAENLRIANQLEMGKKCKDIKK
ncbi:hypothetical protein KKB10_02650 [Patescibacteria group bacterium]|nr:hypothetical protein [Patescibacteria group bacterium]MBU1075410.1 hypothetical protein [Patescibacteria group bacterium]MBU1951645.1 hypothetical protein [Patescibacteria group bacterium]